MALRSDSSREGMIYLALTALGMILALCPLALWVAWSTSLFLAVLAVGAAAIVLIDVLARLGSDPGVDRGESANRRSRRLLPDEFLAEVTRLGQWTYRHRRLGDSRIRRRMPSLEKES